MADTHAPAITLIYNGTLYTPDLAGKQTVLLLGDRIARLGPVDERALAALNLPCTTIDATDCLVLPGLIDPHQHLIGAGGEQGFASRAPEVSRAEILRAGITTVVGCLGTDTISRTGAALVGKVQELRHSGISAYLYTGGFPVPPPTITGSIQRDMLLIDPVIGLGEIAIADVRAIAPTAQELAKYVSETYLGGIMTGKAGVTHFHIGPGASRLRLLHTLIDEHDIPPQCLYPTHITRSPALLAEAIALAKKGSYVDTDTVEPGIGAWLTRYWDGGGPPARLTLSSDAHTQGSNLTLYSEVVAAVRESKLALERVLPCVTRNTAAALQLAGKGVLAVGASADVLVVRPDSLDIVHLFAGGRHLIRAGEISDDTADATNDDEGT